MHRIRPVALLALLSIAPLCGLAQEKPDEGLCGRTFAKLAESYRHFTALEAHFVHTLHAPALGQNEVDEGTLYIEKGGRMRWDYATPPGKLAVADGRESYLYLPSENQVFIQPLGRGPNAPLAIRLLSGDVEPGKDLLCLGASRDGDTVVLRLGLASDAEGVHHLEVRVDKEGKQISEVSYTDSLGNQVDLRLTGIRTPGHLPADLFTFTPPKGAQIIRSAG
jgi:outer membrane lipoprotein carrier protein